MTRAERLQRLRERIAEIGLLPVSPERDRLLSEFRSRCVDVDTGVEPRAVLPVSEPMPSPDRPRRRARRSVTPSATWTALSAPANGDASQRPATATAEHAADTFGVAEWLSLDDALEADVRARGGQSARPWTRGLRG